MSDVELLLAWNSTGLSGALSVKWYDGAGTVVLQDEGGNFSVHLSPSDAVALAVELLKVAQPAYDTAEALDDFEDWVLDPARPIGTNANYRPGVDFELPDALDEPGEQM